MHILIVGTGYVGLVTGACFAEMGHRVACLDVDAPKIDQLNLGNIPIYEPGLEEMVRRHLQAGRLTFTTDAKGAVQSSSVCFITVSTPPLADGNADLEAVKSVARTIATHMDGDRVVINKSTVPVGTAHAIKQIMASILEDRAVPYTCEVVSNPEFLKEGSAVQDCLKPDRIIVGCDNAEVATTLQEIYSSFMIRRDRLILMDVLSAEMTKYAANAMLATRISFMNELAGLCEKMGPNINMIRIGLGTDPRIGDPFLYAGAGFGGSCFPKDLSALQAQARAHNYKTPLLEAVGEVNTKQKRTVGDKMIHYFQNRGSLKGKTIAILGLAFKPDTDDMREAPALVLIQQLVQAGANLRLYDPVAMESARRVVPHLPSVEWCNNEYDAAKGAHAIALMTEWKQFRLLDFSQALTVMEGHAFFDGRNQYHAAEMARHGFDYISIGQQPVYALDTADVS